MMTLRGIRLLTAGLVALLALPGVADAQTGGLTTPIAPGVGAPPVGLPGIGPGNVPVAPGAASMGIPTEQVGAGGVLLAPGMAGSGTTIETPAIPGEPGMSRR